MALKAAQSAASLLPNSALAHRQLRQLCVLGKDIDGALAALEIELRHAKTEERAELLALRVNLHLHGQQDAVSLELALSELQEAKPNDPRPPLYQLVQQLGFGVHAPDPLSDSGPIVGGIARATEQVRRFRAALTSTATGDSSELPASPSLLFHRAQVALSSPDAPGATQALLALAQIPALTLSAKWLAAAFTSAQAGAGSAHLALLKELSAPSGDGIAERAVVREALQAGDDEQVRSVLQAAPEGAFSDLERLTLGALMFAPAQIPSAWIEPLNASEQSPLRNALRAVLGLKLPEGDTSASERLGRLLASGATLTPEELEAVTRERPWIAMLLVLEQDQKANNRSEVVRGLLQWAEQPGFALLNYFAALLCELEANPQRAVSICQKMLALDPGFEPASRMLKELGTPSTVAALELLAEHCDEPERASLLLLEAAEQALATGADNDASALLSAAVQKNPALPFGYLWAKRLTSKCTEPQFVLDWYERERSRGLSDGSLAALGVRTALALAASSPTDAARLLAELALRFPTDLALQFLGESIAKTGWQDLRERTASALPNADRQGLLCEIALGAQSADLRRGVALAEQALHFDDRPFVRALRQHLADQLADPQWLAQVQQLADTSTDPPSRVALLERLAHLAAASGNLPQVQHAWANLLALDPQHLMALLSLQHLQISTAAQADLNATEARLALLLSEEDALALGLLQMCVPSRVAASRPIVQSASQHAVPHFAVLRTALALALMDDDRRQEFAITCKLLEREHGAEDTAALSLRAAEIAYDLGLAQQTFDLTQHALNAVPNHTLGLAVQAQSHQRWEHWSQAAQSLSVFAATSRLPAHRAGALKEAGLLWLNQLSDAERGEAALEEALRLLPPELETECAALTERLAQHYDATQQRLKLIELLDGRLTRTSNEAQQKRLQSLLDKAREEVGATPRPRSVAPKVDASPEHHDALETFARRAFANGDIKGAEGAWLQLVRTVHAPSKQAEYYRNLGQLYQSGQLNLERALVCYAEVRKRLPNDVGVIEKLISLYEQL
ncbi:MAG TPA: hypothetical protein VL137_14025, partial [Polyangiaceae bacterium]|nr:hypothetical protein [Polyangiaceae bacterium]